MTTTPRIVAFRHPDWSSYGPEILAGVVESMAENEIWQLATPNKSCGEMEPVIIDSSWQGDGAILFRATPTELAHFRSRGQAVVLTSSEGPDCGNPRVIPDNRMIGRLAAHHLIECTLAHFAFIGRDETLYQNQEYAPGFRRYSRDRLEGFSGQLAEFEFAPLVHQLAGRPLWESGSWREAQMEVIGFLRSLPLPCGIFAVDDSLAALVMNAAVVAGIRIPEQLAVIGFGNDPSYCYARYPDLTTIAYPGRTIGRKAAELLWRQMQGLPLETMTVAIPVGKVIPRESSNILAVADPEIKRLITYIRLHAPHDTLRVSEIAEMSRMSLSTIKTRFTAALGHGPKTEIQKVRVNHLRHLLTDTELSLEEIASKMKFPSIHELRRFLLAETGLRLADFPRNRISE